MLLAALAAVAIAQAPACPFDERVRALANGGAPLEAIAKTLRALPEVKAWAEDQGEGCTITQPIRVVRVLDGLSQRCASAFVELEVHATGCKEVNVRVGAGTPRYFALVSPDAKGRLVPVWSGFHLAFPEPRTAQPGRVECAGRVEARDAGPGPMLDVVRDATLRFEGCTLRGFDEAVVRREVEACVRRGDSASVTVRFFEGDAGRPTCAVTSDWFETEGVAMVRSGGFVPGGALIDATPRFSPITAYVQPADGGVRWLCNDLSLEATGSQCTPLTIPASASEGCRPSGRGQKLVADLAQRVCEANATGRREVVLGESKVTKGSLQLARLAVDQGDGVGNEGELVEAVRAAVAGVATCGKPEAWDGAVGSFVVSPNGAVLGSRLDGPNAGCVGEQLKVLRRFRGVAKGSSAPVSVYRFRVEVAP
ncbi:MAG: hypothetical protein U0228_30675 [Myxococcaceae bacterium]